MKMCKGSSLYYVSKVNGWVGSEKLQFLLTFSTICANSGWVGGWVLNSPEMCWRNIGMVPKPISALLCIIRKSSIWIWFGWFNSPKKLWILMRKLVFECIISQSDLVEFWKMSSKRDSQWHLSTYFVSITYFVLVTQLYTSELYISIQSLWRISTNKIFFCNVFAGLTYI